MESRGKPAFHGLHSAHLKDAQGQACVLHKATYSGTPNFPQETDLARAMTSTPAGQKKVSHHNPE